MKISNFIDIKYKLEPPTYIYHIDYPSVKIGGDNPYYKCAACGVSDPEINGRLEGHRSDCEWASNKKKL